MILWAWRTLQMQLSGIELSAIAKLAFNMASADGHIDDRETQIIANGFRYFGVSAEQAKPMIVAAALVDNKLAEGVISELAPSQKELVTAWLVSVVIADGKIAVGELDYMRHLSVQCGLPNLTPAEARYQLERIKGDSKPSTSGEIPRGGGCMIPIVLLCSSVLGLVYWGHKLFA